jgi:hypothetical protein
MHVSLGIGKCLALFQNDGFGDIWHMFSDQMLESVLISMRDHTMAVDMIGLTET